MRRINHGNFFPIVLHRRTSGFLVYFPSYYYSSLFSKTSLSFRNRTFLVLSNVKSTLLTTLNKTLQISNELKQNMTKCLSFPFLRFSTSACGNEIQIHWVIHNILQLYSTVKFPCWQWSERRHSIKAAVNHYKTAPSSLQMSHSRGDAVKGSHHTLSLFVPSLPTDDKLWFFFFFNCDKNIS